MDDLIVKSVRIPLVPIDGFAAPLECSPPACVYSHQPPVALRWRAQNGPCEEFLAVGFQLDRHRRASYRR